MDDSGTTDEGGRWLSYAELAELRGITRKAAIRLTQRHQWRRQPGNDGATRVFVPADIASRQTPRDGGTPAPLSDDTGHSAFKAALAAIREAKDSEIATLREVIDGLRSTIGRTEDRANRAEQTADALRDQIEDLRAKLASAQAEPAALRDRVEALQAQVAQLGATQIALGEAEADAAELRRAEEARKARGRLRRAWDGWRGQ